MTISSDERYLVHCAGGLINLANDIARAAIEHLGEGTINEEMISKIQECEKIMINLLLIIKNENENV